MDETSRVVPSVTPHSVAEFNEQLDRVVTFAKRICLDFMDGTFAAPASPNLIQAHWPVGQEVDLHLMYQRPADQESTVISLAPHLAIIHAEAEGDLLALMKAWQAVGVKAGVALLPQTQPAAAPLIAQADHVLIFGGTLGRFGGQFDPSLLTKVPAIRQIKSNVEIGWDGGVNDKNLEQILNAGVDVVNVGGFIQKASDPRAAYQRLVSLAQEVKS